MSNKNTLSISDIKYLTVPNGMLRYSLSRNTMNQLAEKAGARIHVGRKVLIDREKLDAYLEAQSEGGENE